MITLLLLLLASRTVIRSFDWRDELTLVMHDIKISGSYDLENGLGSELIKQHKLAEAKQHVEKSIMLYPSLTNYLNLGVIYMKMGEYQKAKDAYISALRYGDYYLVYEGLAALTIISYDTPTGIKFTEFALKKFPTDGKLWFYLAILEYKAKNIDAAKEAITQAYRYNQDSETDSVYKTIMNGATLNIKASE